jgi:hypothetical protein
MIRSIEGNRVSREPTNNDICQRETGLRREYRKVYSGWYIAEDKVWMLSEEDGQAWA